MISSGPGRAVGPPPQALDPPMTTLMAPLQVCTLNKWGCSWNTIYATLIIKKTTTLSLMDKLTPKTHHSLHTVPINIDIFRVYSTVCKQNSFEFLCEF